MPEYADVGNPHCMLLMENDVHPKEDLLRGEILAILCVIGIRLNDPYFEDRSVIPVRASLCFSSSPKPTAPGNGVLLCERRERPRLASAYGRGGRRYPQISLL